tara:strand:+ start:1465 stop:2637 length:1173 start_codon:yes stop_codon:yes gene_type:complete
MSFKNTPITAKIKRTTQGGMVQQPILNMGGPVKMKASSPAKVDPDPTKKKQEDFKNEMANQVKTKAADLAASKLKKAADNKSLYQRKADAYRFNATSLPQAEKNQKNSSWYSVQSVREGADNKKASMKKFETELFNYDTKNKAGSTEGYTAQEYAMAKTSGTYKSKATVDPPANDPPANDPPANDLTKNKKSYDQAYKDTRGHKVYGKMDKATYIKEAKRQNASKKAGKGWDASGKGKTVNISNNVSTSNTVEPTSKVTKKQEATQSAKNNVAVNTKKKVNTKAAIKPTSKQIRKNASADRKDSRAQRVSVKAEEARASGNTSKADRLDKREARIKKRASKKRGQAAGAIEVKKKTKKQSFNAVTNQSGYDSFKKAGGLSAWSKGEIEIK